MEKNKIKSRLINAKTLVDYCAKFYLFPLLLVGLLLRYVDNLVLKFKYNKNN